MRSNRGEVSEETLLGTALETLLKGVPCQSRDDPKGAGAQGRSMSGQGTSPLCPPTPMGLWPVENPPEQKKTAKEHGGAAAAGNPARGPDLSHRLCPHQRNWDRLSVVHRENKGGLEKGEERHFPKCLFNYCSSQPKVCVNWQ